MRLPLALVIMLAFTGVGAAGDDPAVTLALSLERDHYYQGERIPVTVTLRARQAVRNLGYPALASPASAAGFDAPHESRDRAGEAETEVFSFRGSLTASAPGELIVGPASLSCEVLDGAEGSVGYFGALQPRKLQLTSPAATVRVLPLPSAGRPASFSGAVGTFSLQTAAVPASAAAGEPVTVTSTISGAGNLDSAACPNLTPAGGKGYPVTARRSRGVLSCEQVLLLPTGGELPPLRWSFFDPERRVYRTLQRRVPVSLAAPAEAPPPTAARPAPSPPPRQDRRSHGFPLQLAGLVAAVTLLVGISTWYRRRPEKAVLTSRGVAEVTPQALCAEAEALLRSGDVEKFYTLLFTTLQALLARHAAVPPETVASVPEHLRCHPALHRLWDHCQEVRYGGKSVHPREMREDLDAVLELRRDTAR